MRNRVERLRMWLLGGTVFLVLVIVAFIGSARYLRRHYLAQLPTKLGVNIVRETNGYTYCQTVQGRTAYCIHAAKAIEHTDGKVGLHDVSIALYGKKSDRNDRIYGDEFEYDKNAEVVRATGVVHIDLQTAEAAGRAKQDTAAGAKVIHVTTSGLVYLQKLGVAATSDAVEFQAGGITGHAVGADYTSDSGMLMLHSAVSMSGTRGGHPLALTAATAEFDERSQQAFLTRATYASEGQTAAAEQATLYRRDDGTLSRVTGKGDVTIKAGGSTVTAEDTDVALTATGQPQTVVLTGGVKYASDAPLRQLRGQADEATITFDKQDKPQPANALFVGAAHMTERLRATAAANDPWSTRDLVAAKVEATLVPTEPGKAGSGKVGSGKSVLQDVAATGNSHLTVVNNGSLANNAGEGTTELSADTLNAHLIETDAAKETPQLDTIVGRGHTLMRQMTVDGIEQTSAADTLDAKFRPKPAADGVQGSTVVPAGENFSESLLSSVQQGHVTMMRRVPQRSAAKAGGTAARRTPAGDDVEHASAERAVYDGDLDRMTLSGGVQVTDAGSVLWANQVALDHKTGDSHAAGAVKVNYAEDASSGGTKRIDSQPAEPTHVLADRADLDHAKNVVTFYGRPARLWQGGNQVQAPVMEFSGTQKRLVARGDGVTSNSAQVHTVLSETGSDGLGTVNPGAAKAGAGVRGCSSSSAAKLGGGGAGAGAQSASVVQIASGGLIYSSNLGQADFTGGFRAETVDGTIRASEGTAYLRQAAAGGDAGGGRATASSPSIAGDLDRVVATGRVELDKPGLKATGERLVYTADDRSALLTGDEKNPPRAIEAQGTTTGNALRFRSSCDSSGGGSVEGDSFEVLGAPGQRVHTDARISDDGKKEKGKQ